MNQIYRGRFYLSVIAFDLWRLIYQNFEQPAQSHMPTAIFLKHNKLKMSKTHFFSNGTLYLLLHWSKAFLRSFPTV
jgi:hypothetical protein